MRILFLTNYYPPFEVGGYEQLCRDVAVRLIQRGHEIAILTSNRGVKDQGKNTEAENVYRVLAIQPDYNRQLGAAGQFFLTRSWANRHNRRWFRQLVAECKPDIIFIWNLQGLTRWLAVDAESIPDTAVAYWLAGYSPAEPDEFWHYWSLQPKQRSRLGFIKAVLRKTAFAFMRLEGQPPRPTMRHVAVVSQFMRQKGIAEGTLPEHTQVIYNGVELDQFLHPVQARTDQPLRLLQAGRVSDDKGVHTAVEAVNYLMHEWGFHDVQLTVAGSGQAGYLMRLEEMVRRFDLGSNVHLTGWLEREQMPMLIAGNHILLLPTTHPEPFARAVLEGMAGGLAIVAADTGGTSEIVRHNETGVLFPAGDSRRLAAEIFRLAQDDKLRQDLAVAGQRVVCEQFDLERMVHKLEDFVRQAVGH